jgi:hypothetical protein
MAIKLRRVLIMAIVNKKRKERKKDNIKVKVIRVR